MAADLDEGERDELLIMTLLKNVNRDNFYPASEIKAWMAEELGEEPRWLTSRWVGRALKRLGVREKRRVRGRVEWRITPRMAERISRLVREERLKMLREKLRAPLRQTGGRLKTQASAEKKLDERIHF